MATSSSGSTAGRRSMSSFLIAYGHRMRVSAAVYPDSVSLATDASSPPCLHFSPKQRLHRCERCERLCTRLRVGLRLSCVSGRWRASALVRGHVHACACLRARACVRVRVRVLARACMCMCARMCACACACARRSLLLGVNVLTIVLTFHYSRMVLRLFRIPHEIAVSGAFFDEFGRRLDPEIEDLPRPRQRFGALSRRCSQLRSRFSSVTPHETHEAVGLLPPTHAQPDEMVRSRRHLAAILRGRLACVTKSRMRRPSPAIQH
eukprot:1703491-Pleurochrysis_carterae.AAC.2